MLFWVKYWKYFSYIVREEANERKTKGVAQLNKFYDLESQNTSLPTLVEEKFEFSIGGIIIILFYFI